MKAAYFRSKKPFFFQNLFFSLSKAILFHLKHRKFPPSHNLLSSKEHGYSFVVRSKSLCCKTRTSHRFKAFSPPFCAKSRFRLVPSETSVKIFSGRALNRGRRTESRVLFGYFLHDAKSNNPFPLQGASRFCKPRINTQTTKHRKEVIL